jgi:hypothetical protein
MPYILNAVLASAKRWRICEALRYFSGLCQESRGAHNAIVPQILQMLRSRTTEASSGRRTRWIGESEDRSNPPSWRVIE